MYISMYKDTDRNIHANARLDRAIWYMHMTEKFMYMYANVQVDRIIHAHAQIIQVVCTLL